MIEQQEPACVVAECKRPEAPGIRLCASHAARLGDWVARVAVEYALLDARPSMQGREPGTGGAGGLASQRSPASLDVIAMRDPRSREQSDEDPDGNRILGVYETLHAHAEYVREERNLAYPVELVGYCDGPCMHRTCWERRPYAIPVPLTILTERRVLAANLDWLMAQDVAGDFYRDIRQLWSLMKSRNAPEPRTTRRRCGCGGNIRWRDGAAECGSCGTRTTGLDVVRQQQGAVA